MFTGQRFSAHWFTLVFCLAYGLIFALELPLPGYYPLTGRWAFADYTATDGTVMHWYGLTLEALLAGTVAGFAVPERWLPRLAKLGILATPWLLMGFCLVLLRSYFQG